MKIRNLAVTTGLALIISGCAIGPRHYESPTYSDQYSGYDDGYDAGYDNGYYDYHNTPAYDGYYYVRVIFIGSIPYYVDDDRHIRPVPPQYRAHFERQRNRRLPPPVFSRDREVRDGYPMSRIVYMDGVPYYVDNDRGARPLPSNLRERFRYQPVPQENPRALPRPEDRRDNAPSFGREREQNQPPAFGREREQNQPPAFGREREQNQPPAFGREREQNQPPAYGREREQNQPPSYGREREQNPQPTFGREQNLPPFMQRERQEQRQEIRTQEREQRMTPGGRGEPQSRALPQRGQRDTGNAVPAKRGEASKGSSRRSNGRNGNGQDDNANREKRNPRNRD